VKNIVWVLLFLGGGRGSKGAEIHRAGVSYRHLQTPVQLLHSSPFPVSTEQKAPSQGHWKQELCSGSLESVCPKKICLHCV
jgi:hypothetical protein